MAVLPMLLGLSALQAEFSNQSTAPGKPAAVTASSLGCSRPAASVRPGI